GGQLVGDRICYSLRILNVADDDADDGEWRALSQLQYSSLHRRADIIDVILDIQPVVFLNLVARVGSKRLLDEILVSGPQRIVAGAAEFLDEVFYVDRLHLPQQMSLELDVQIVLGKHSGRADKLFRAGVRHHRDVGYVEHPAEPRRGRSRL